MKKNNNRRKKNLFHKKNNHNVTWLLVGLLLGIGIPFFIHIGLPKHNNTASKDRVAAQEKHVQKATPNYDFYTMLGKQDESVEHPMEPATQNLETKDIPPPNSQKYSLQVASFKSRSEADKLRAELIIQGYNVLLSPIKRGENTLIRVQVGPFKTLKQAQKIQHDLAESAIKTLLIKM